MNEYYDFEMAPDAMWARARFYPASDTGSRMTLEEFKKDMEFRTVKFGLQEKLLAAHFASKGRYNQWLPVVKGKPARQGTDARIEYFFNTDLRARPEIKEDGSVDFFNLNVVNKCKKGEVLAKIIPADEGDPGMNILGTVIKPREVKKALFKHGNNMEISEDRLTLTSTVDGHVMLVGGSVFVNNVYTVQDVGVATGNIDFDGSVQIQGNVASNFSVKSGGDIIVDGVVEGAKLEAAGNVVIAKGMNGRGTGTIKAGGNVISKFFENATVEAEGYVQTESILHSTIASNCDITVTGKKGFIAGGHVQAKEKVDAKTLGSNMGADTIIEVGASPAVKKEFAEVNKAIKEITADLKQAQPILENFAAKKAKGARFNELQLKEIKQTSSLVETRKKELEENNKRMEELQKLFDPTNPGSVYVRGEVYPGTTIVIGELSMNVQSSFKYCKFEVVRGDVKMVPL